jgi:uncharacterized membrane protein YGL010W
MKTLLDQLANYAEYHRCERNIATHLVGVPLIVIGILVLLSRPVWVIEPLALSPAVGLVTVFVLYYLRLHAVFGVIMGTLCGLCLVLGAYVAALDDTTWLAAGVGCFLVGWVIQFIGHYFEGRKPAFFDDVMGLAIGPLFVLAEVLFKLGAFTMLKAAIEERAGPTRP